MVAVPPLTPVTMPVLPTVAMAVLVLLQVPPGAMSDKVVLLPAHTVGIPVMVPAFSAGPMVSTLVVTAVPQLLVTVYFIVSIPGLMAVITPLPLIVAITKLLRLHTPPPDALV